MEKELTQILQRKYIEGYKDAITTIISDLEKHNVKDGVFWNGYEAAIERIKRGSIPEMD